MLFIFSTCVHSSALQTLNAVSLPLSVASFAAMKEREATFKILDRSLGP